ncbi:hypothetical protein LCGC14_1032800 [marine sediment metagenome]|uniref:Type II secretion system protein GspI C-terminal domain-containing protein n=1 Tax=marine sediment metagenome TaxID=412755 RepID=A0A0F9MU50_9ZZZZ
MKKSQKGFTLLEILLVLVVGGLLLVGVVNAIFQTTTITVERSTQITALEDIREVAAQVSKDIRMAATTNLENGLTLAWTVWYDETGELNPVDHYISYTPPSGGELQRNYDGALTTVGSYISDIEFSQEVNIITMAITSSPRGNAETAEQRTYQFYLQPKEDLVQ